MNCPVCKNPLKQEQHYLECVLAEYSETCENCEMYLYEFAYGANRTIIAGTERIWSYNENRPIKEILQDVIRAKKYLLDITETTWRLSIQEYLQSTTEVVCRA